MSTIAKVFVVVVFALSIAFAVSSALLMNEQDKQQKAYADLKTRSKSDTDRLTSELQKATDDCSDKAKQLTKAKDDVSRLTSEKEALEKDKAQLQTDNANKEKRLNELGTSFSAIKAGIGDWAQRNEKLQKEVGDLQANLAKTQEELRTTKADCEKAKLDRDEAIKKQADAEGRKKDIEDQLIRAKELLAKLEASGAINVSEAILGVQKPIDGRVLEVDPTNNVVVISVGKDQGVGLGYSFTVYRADEYIGEIKVEQLQNDLAGAAPVAGTLKSEIRKGDNVTTRIR